MSTDPAAIGGDAFREAMSHWPTGVSIVAYRDTQRVVATTVSAFMSLSLDPPLVLLALAPNATVRPFLVPGAHFGVSVLGHDQRRLATIFADPFPVGPDPFDDDPAPLVRGAMAGFRCAATDVRTGGDHALVIAAVTAISLRPTDPVVRFRREYRTLYPPP